MEFLIATLLDLLLAVIATEAATNLITKSEFSIRFIKEPLFRLRRFKCFNFIHDILDCGYCSSVWMAIIFAIFFLTDTFNIVIVVLVIHRLSNVLHITIDWLDEKRSRDLDTTSKGEDYEWLREEHDTPVVTHDEEISGTRAEDSSR
jgi:hypothetical protein